MCSIISYLNTSFYFIIIIIIINTIFFNFPHVDIVTGLLNFFALFSNNWGKMYFFLKRGKKKNNFSRLNENEMSTLGRLKNVSWKSLIKKNKNKDYNLNKSREKNFFPKKQCYRKSSKSKNKQN